MRRALGIGRRATWRTRGEQERAGRAILLAFLFFAALLTLGRIALRLHADGEAMTEICAAAADPRACAVGWARGGRREAFAYMDAEERAQKLASTH